MDRRIQKTKDAIQAAYFSLIKEKRTSRITIAEIARRANIDRKTFYLHYETIEDIVKEFSKERIQSLLFALEKEDFFERPIDVNCFFQVLNTFIEQDIDFYRHIAADENCDFFWNTLCDILLCTLKDVYFDTVDLTKEQFNIYALYISNGFIAIYRSWLKKEIPVSIEELGKITGDMTYYGIQKLFPEKGAGIP